MRGRRYVAVAVRAPSSRIVLRSERLPARLYGGWLGRTPFLRGLTLLWDSLGLGMKALMFSADVAQEGEETATLDRPLQWGSLAVALVLGIGGFFLLPLGAAGLLEQAVPNPLVVHLFEGLVRLGLLVGYVWAIGNVPEIRRVFAYHGAEHMTIHAFEAGEPLDVEHIKKHPPAHPRCGTAFLLLVVAISVILFTLMGNQDWPTRILSRILGIPVIAGIAYEVLKLAGAHADNPLVRVIVAPGLALQSLTTRYPDPDMIEVAVAAFGEMRRLELGGSTESTPTAG
jgi:uncharacterized protein YqhQ